MLDLHSNQRKSPKDTILFGWKKSGDGWHPTEPTISPLLQAEEPTTVTIDGSSACQLSN